MVHGRCEMSAAGYTRFGAFPWVLKLWKALELELIEGDGLNNGSRGDKSL